MIRITKKICCPICSWNSRWSTGNGVAFLAGTALGNAAMAYSGRGKTDEHLNKSMPLARFINWAIG